MARNSLRKKLGSSWNEYQRLRKNLKVLRFRVKNVDNVIRWRKNTKRTLIEYKGGKCERCGFDRDIPGAYDFHHRDPEEKDFQVSGSTRSLEKLKAEADKCELLCKICHVLEHESDSTNDRDKRVESLNVKIKKTEKAMKELRC